MQGIGKVSLALAEEQLKSASVILLPVSADFLASDCCCGVEVQCALD
jgi:hypothetical protein